MISSAASASATDMYRQRPLVVRERPRPSRRTPRARSDGSGSPRQVDPWPGPRSEVESSRPVVTCEPAPDRAQPWAAAGRAAASSRRRIGVPPTWRAGSTKRTSGKAAAEPRPPRAREPALEERPLGAVVGQLQRATDRRPPPPTGGSSRRSRSAAGGVEVRVPVERPVRRPARRSSPARPPILRPSPPRPPRFSSTTGDGSIAERAGGTARRSGPSPWRPTMAPRRAGPRSPPGSGTARPVRVASVRSTRARPSSIRAASQRRAVLVLEQHEVARCVDACLASGVVEQHQRQQPGRLGLVGEQRDDDPCQPDRLRTQLAPDERVARRRRVPLVEDQIQHLAGRHRAARAGARAAGPGTGSRRRGSCAWPGRGAGRASVRGRGTRGRSRAS